MPHKTRDNERNEKPNDRYKNICCIFHSMVFCQREAGCLNNKNSFCCMYIHAIVSIAYSCLFVEVIEENKIK